MTGGKKPKTPATKGPQHVDDNEFELDMNTGKFIRKKAVPETEKGDESTSRKRKSTAGKTPKASDTSDTSKSRNKKKKKTVTLVEEEANDDDLQIVDDEDLDKDYEPEDDDENDEDDDDNYPQMDDDLDDFEIPPLRQRKTTKEVAQKKKPKTTQRRVDKSSKDDGIDDETLSLFQWIVGDTFEVHVTEEYEEESEE